MKVLITGVGGFIGSHLARRLLGLGHQVVGVARAPVPDLKLDRMVVGDVLDSEVVSAAIEGVDAIYHLAAITAHSAIVNNRYETLDVNFLGTKNILNAFIRSKSAQKFFYSSTGKVYGDILRLPLDESHPTLPLNLLGKSKLITERLVDFYSGEEKGFGIFRIFNVFGEGQRSSFFIPTLLEQIKRAVRAPGSPTLRLGDVQARRDYVYVGDVVDAFCAGLGALPFCGLKTMNICSGKGRSGMDIIQAAQDGLGRILHVDSNPSLRRGDEKAEEYGSFEAIERLWGWRPSTDVLGWVKGQVQGFL